MKAIVGRRYGLPLEVLRLEDVPEPGHPDECQVLVRVVAAGVNALDKHLVLGEPRLTRLAGTGLRAPRRIIAGRDVAGVVAAVGPGVTGFRPGDEVLGCTGGTFAEFTTADEESLVPKPARLTFVEAAALPIAGMTALQALRQVADVQPGQRVLITGASGGVGSFAVQIAAALGAEVTAVCATRNVDWVGGLGAGQVVDYTAQDWTARGQQYDVVLELAGRPPLGAVRHSLVDGGIQVLSGGEGGRFLGPVPRGLAAMVGAVLTRSRSVMFLANERRETLAGLLEFVEAGTVKPIVEHTFPLAEGAAAVEHLRQGHTRGKTVVSVSA